MEKPEARDRNIALRWRTGNLTPAEHRRRVRQRRRYKLPIEKMNDLLEAQDFRCAICKVELTRPIVDHNHQNGAVRGLLCASCNTGLGQFEDDPRIVLDAYFYLMRHLKREQEVAGIEEDEEEVDPLA